MRGSLRDGIRRPETSLREASGIEDPVCTFADRQGWLVRKLQWRGRDGAPDDIFIRQGRVVFIEFKRPGRGSEGRSTSQIQESKHLVNHGAEYYVVDSFEHGCDILA